MKKPISQDTFDAVKLLVRMKKTGPVIAESLGISESSVYYIKSSGSLDDYKARRAAELERSRLKTAPVPEPKKQPKKSQPVPAISSDTDAILSMLATLETKLSRVIELLTLAQTQQLEQHP